MFNIRHFPAASRHSQMFEADIGLNSKIYVDIPFKVKYNMDTFETHLNQIKCQSLRASF